MTSSPLIDLLLAHVATARSEVVLVAPFIKRSVLEACVSEIRPDVELRVFTRWDPAEVAAGVSDPEIITIPGLEEAVELVPSLHAKAYVADDVALVGSANLTERALGMGEVPANLEVLIKTGATSPEVATLLQEVHASGRATNANYAEAVRQRADLVAGEAPGSEPVSVTRFFPTAREPARLLATYSGARHESPADMDAKADLMRLAVPHGLSDEDFHEFVAAVLRDHPDLVPLYATGQVDSETLRGVLVDELGVARAEADRRVETLVLWLKHFVGDVRTQPIDFDIRLGKEFP